MGSGNGLGAPALAPTLFTEGRCLPPSPFAQHRRPLNAQQSGRCLLPAGRQGGCAAPALLLQSGQLLQCSPARSPALVALLCPLLGTGQDDACMQPQRCNYRVELLQTAGPSSGFIFQNRSRTNPTLSWVPGAWRCLATSNAGSAAQPCGYSTTSRGSPGLDVPKHLLEALLPAVCSSPQEQTRPWCFPTSSPHSMAAGSCPSTSRVLEFASSLRISTEICGWLWNLSSSSRASFCSEDRSSL